MTWGVDKRVAEETSTGRSMGTSLDPGRGVKLPPATAPGVDDKRVNGQDPCTVDGSGSGCLLDPDVRDRLVAAYKDRVGSAHTEYVATLTSLRVDELLKHEDSDIGWIAGLILSLGAGYITTLIGGACRLLMTLNTAERAAAVAAIGPTRPITAAFAVEKQIDAMMSNIAGTARAYGIPAAGAAQVAPAMQEHGRTVNFLDILLGQAGVLFQELREKPPGTATDEQMIAMWSGMDAKKGHTITHYKPVLLEAIEKFKRSRVSWIGKRQGTFAASGEVIDRDTPHAFKRDAELQTRVVWLTRLANHGAPRLCYFDDRRSAKWKALNTGRINTAKIIDEFEFTESVEDGFVDTALERHREAWGENPKSMVIDDRDPQNIRMLVDPFGAGVPKLQLGGAK